MNTPESTPVSPDTPTHIPSELALPPLPASTAPESPPAIVVAPTSASQTGGVSILAVLVIAVACSAVSGYTAWRFATRSQAVSVVVLDAAKIASARMDKEIDGGSLNEADAAAAGKKFVQDLNTEVDRYTQAGIVVINSAVTLNRPPALDVTTDVAAALGVHLK